MKKTITFAFSGYSGIDVALGILPERWQAKVVAKRLLRDTYKGLDLAATRLVVQMPNSAYAVKDERGNVEPAIADSQLPLV